MIRDRKTLESLAHDLIRKSGIDIERNFQIVDALYQEALSLNTFLRDHPLDGSDNILHIAKVVNSAQGTPH